MSIYQIGVGKADITDPTNGLQLQGFADVRQKSEGVLHEIFSRAFVIQENPGDSKVAIAIAEIWSCTKELKLAVLKLLVSRHRTEEFTEENLHIAGTHTHSAPGGYAGYKLYNQPILMTNENERKKAEKTTRIIASGIAKSIAAANKNLKEGKIYIHKGTVENCGAQRSKEAYNNNPQRERNKFGSDTDKEMLLLKFVHFKNGLETPIGVLNWYAIHPTDIGQYNKHVSGDNKGCASRLFEHKASEELGIDNFVAAFANSNCGDVSGNMGIDMADEASALNYEVNMKNHGELQYNEARALFDTADRELEGSISTWYRHIQMDRVRIKNTTKRTWPYSLGLSFTAGSQEDGASVYELFGSVKTVLRSEASEGLTKSKLTETNKKFLKKTSLGMRILLGSQFPKKLKDEEIKGHLPKPIAFTGKNREEIVPSRLPIQVLKIGDFCLLGVPAELNTMAGRRLREQLLEAYEKVGIKDLALGTYANDYSQYISTRQEYQMQHYEGASTPFGPYTLQAYIQEFKALPYPDDQYIDCLDDSSKDVIFYLEYEVAAGRVKKVSSRTSVDSFRFHIPYDAQEARIQAKFKRGSEWKSTRWQKIGLTGSKTAQKVTFNGRTIKYSGEIEDKEIECVNASVHLREIFIECHYTSATGIRTKRVSGPNVKFYWDLTVPWNASDFEVQVFYDRKNSSSNVVKFDFGSHQKVRLEFMDGVLLNRGIVSEW